MNTVSCMFCQGSFTLDQCYRRVEGFEKPRKSGGANQIVLRHETGEYACWQCIERTKHGIPADQGTLL